MGTHSRYVLSLWTFIVRGLVALTILKNDTLPKRGESLKISCLTSPVQFIGQLTNTWNYPSRSAATICLADGYVCTGNRNYNFTADNNGAYVTIYSLDRVRDSGTWTCIGSDNLGTNSTVITVYTSPKGVRYVQPIVSEADLGQESINVICQTDNCTFPPPSMLWFYLNNQQQKVRYDVSDDVMVNNTAPCDQLEAIYTSTLHLTRGTTFQGNIPFKTKFVCGIQHPALDGVIQYSENSHYVNFAVNLTSVILKDVNDNALPSTMELAQGSVVILKCVTSTSRPTATVRWYIGSTNVVSGVENIAKPGENGLEYMESNLTFTLNSNEHHSKYIYCQAYSSLSSSVLQSTQHMLSVTGYFAVGVAQGDVLISWSTNVTDITNFRFVANPSGVNIIRFNPYNVTGTAVIAYSNKVTDIGNVSLGIVSFRLLSLTVADAGRYYFKAPLIASVDGGQILVIAGVPANMSVIEVSNPLENAKYTIQCSAQSTSVPMGMGLTMRYQWKRENGQHINMSDRYSFSSDQSNLIINPLKRQDDGTFLCEAWEHVGAVSQSDPFSLKVIYGPDSGSIHFSPSGTSHELTESSSLTVNCSADCFPDCQYRWTGPDGRIVSSTGLLYFIFIGRNQYGQFTCTALNSRLPIQLATSSITLKVFYGPDDGNVSLSPSNLVYKLTELSRLDVNCSATCEPQCHYHWSGPLVSQTDNNGWLSISQIQRNQNGTFICTATNAKFPGKSATANFNVLVYYGPDTNGLTLFPSNTSYQLTESSPFTVQCAAICEPQCHYQWMGPGISQNDNHGLLSVSEISRNQSGTFTCTVTNPKNPGKSVTANLYVIVYYSLDVFFHYSESNNSTVLLMCITSGEPLQYTFHEWIHKVGDTEIRRLAGDNTANASTLTLTNISIEDMGIYVCTVDVAITGQIGPMKLTGHTDVFVHGTLFTESTNSLFTGMINKSARIEIPFYSSPSSTTVKFYRGANTVEVTNTSDTLIFLSSFPNTLTLYGKEVFLNGQIAVLYFKMVKATEFGEYTAVLFNDFENTSRRIVFSLGEAETPAKFYITDVQEKQVTLQWLYGDHRGFDQTFVIQTSMDNITWTNASLINSGKTEEWFYATITGLKSNTVYYFRFISFNVNGGSDIAGIHFVIRTLQESPSSRDIGVSIGIGFGGFFIGVFGAISVMIIIWKRNSGAPKYSSTREAEMSTDIQTYVNTGVISLSTTSHYEELQQDCIEKTLYDHI